MNNLVNQAVKALIYRSDGNILLQQRDCAPGLPFPGYWTFFGGLVEPGESLQDALKRELIEELGCVPGQLETKLFQWEWQSDWASTQNHFFSVYCEIETNNLELKEGKGMAWFALEDFIELPLTPDVYENFSGIVSFLAELRPDMAKLIEDRLLVFNNLQKKNDRVFYTRENPCELSRQQIFLLKELASLHNIHIFRVCLHTNDQCDIHEMLMVHTVPGSVGPLKQNKSSLSYHIIEGALTIKMYDENGAVLKEYFLGKGALSKANCISLRLNASQYRSVHSTSPFAIFLEVASGPFQDCDTQWLYQQFV